jgi:hypothetical protein
MSLPMMLRPKSTQNALEEAARTATNIAVQSGELDILRYSRFFL